MEGPAKISIVVPVYNEADNVGRLYQAIVGQLEVLDVDFEIVLVDDGSRDGSRETLESLHARDARVKVIGLSRNFGHQNAVSAGLERASGDAVIAMDADLQHPPELLPQMIDLWREGVQVVYTIREDDAGASLLKRCTSAAFYKMINAVSDVPIVTGAADFRLLDRKVVDQLVAMPERARFLRGMVSWLGFRQQAIRFRANPRFSGRSKYSLRKMFALAAAGITSFSSVPLRVSAFLGLATALGVFPYALWAIYARCFTDTAVPGWASLTVAVLFLGGVQLMSIGVLGEYVGRIYAEVKGRPLYVADALLGFDAAGRTGDRAAPVLRISPQQQPQTESRSA